MAQLLLNCAKATPSQFTRVIGSSMKESTLKRSGSIEPQDLSQFEGEGGRLLSPSDLIDVPMNKGIWRRQRQELVPRIGEC